MTKSWLTNRSYLPTAHCPRDLFFWKLPFSAIQTAVVHRRSRTISSLRLTMIKRGLSKALSPVA